MARAYLYSNLSDDDRAVAEGAMIMLLDDPSPLVRRALAEALCAQSTDAPPAVIQALATDQPEIAVLVLERSELFIDADLVEIVATGDATIQCAIASRQWLQRSVAAAIAEVGAPEACLTLIENPGADIAPFSVNRSSNATGILRRSAKRCWRATTFRRDTSVTGRKACGSAGGFRQRARLAGARSCAAGRAGSLRERLP